MTLPNGHCPASGSIRCAASVDLRSVATEFCSDGLYAISRNSPVREFFSRNAKFFWTRGKSSLVNIPNCNRYVLVSLVFTTDLLFYVACIFLCDLCGIWHGDVFSHAKFHFSWCVGVEFWPQNH